MQSSSIQTTSAVFLWPWHVLHVSAWIQHRPSDVGLWNNVVNAYNLCSIFQSQVSETWLVLCDHVNWRTRHTSQLCLFGPINMNNNLSVNLYNSHCAHSCTVSVSFVRYLQVWLQDERSPLVQRPPGCGKWRQHPSLSVLRGMMHMWFAGSTCVHSVSQDMYCMHMCVPFKCRRSGAACVKHVYECVTVRSKVWVSFADILQFILNWQKPPIMTFDLEVCIENKHFFVLNFNWNQQS